MERKVAAQGTRLSSFREAKESLAETLEVHLTVKQIERVTERIGAAAVVRRDSLVAAWEALPLVQKEKAPEGVTSPEIAVVAADGGRLQLTERHTETGTHWRENKAAVLMEMTSPRHEKDPCPAIPENFLDSAWADRLTREIGKRAAVEPRRNNVSEPPREESVVDQIRIRTGLIQPDDNPDYPRPATDAPRREPPKMVRKRVVSTLEDIRSFSPQVATTAWSLGFFASQRKAYVGDGQNWVWSLFEERFKPFGFVGILDFIHALTYVYAAATAGRDEPAGVLVYHRWITWIWEGRVEEVIVELTNRQAEVGLPLEADGETHPRRIIEKSLTYLSNQRSRMNYPEYRKQGLPISSAYIESVVKQLNQRVKGSEKFWSRKGGEALLQLKSAQISGQAPWDVILHEHQDSADGQRPQKHAA